MKLTNIQCKNAKTKEKAYKLSAGKGLFLLVMPNGAKYWRMKYRYLGKEKLLSLGVYDEVLPKEAEDKCLNARRLLESGLDPSVYKQDSKKNNEERFANSFEVVARKWHEEIKSKWTERHAGTVLGRMERDVFPVIGKLPIDSITPPQILDCLKKIQARGAIEPAHRMRQSCGQVFRFAIANGWTTLNAASDLSEAIKPIVRTHYPALQPNEIPELLRTLERNDACLRMDTRLAIHLMMLTFVRTKELVEAKWSEINFKDKEWIIPAERMKMRKEHIVPLSDQAVEILEQLKATNGNWEWVFPGHHSPRKHMSNNTIRQGLGRMGFLGRMTGHGFRALAMTTIKEKLGYRHEVIDRQLAHADKSMVTRAYDRAKFLDERKKMMQEWADYLDTLAKNNGFSIKRAA